MNGYWGYRDRSGDMSEWAVLLICIVGVFASIAALTIGMVLCVARPIDQASCAGYGHATGLRVKFVDYAFGSWDCLEYVHGHWQPKGNDVAVTPR